MHCAKVVQTNKHQVFGDGGGGGGGGGGRGRGRGRGRGSVTEIPTNLQN